MPEAATVLDLTIPAADVSGNTSQRKTPGLVSKRTIFSSTKKLFQEHNFGRLGYECQWSPQEQHSPVMATALYHPRQDTNKFLLSYLDDNSFIKPSDLITFWKYVKNGRHLCSGYYWAGHLIFCGLGWVFDTTLILSIFFWEAFIVSNLCASHYLTFKLL